MVSRIRIWIVGMVLVGGLLFALLLTGVSMLRPEIRPSGYSPSRPVSAPTPATVSGGPTEPSWLTRHGAVHVGVG